MNEESIVAAYMGRRNKMIITRKWAMPNRDTFSINIAI